jgi:uncharacterized protein with HEPN domain
MNKKDINRLTHMLDAAMTIIQHVKDKIQTDLEQDRLLFGGVIRELMVIGEAANAVSAETQTKFSNIPWRQIVGMRNQLVHAYFEINYKIIWITVRDELPKLITELQKVLS